MSAYRHSWCSRDLSYLMPAHEAVITGSSCVPSRCFNEICEPNRECTDLFNRPSLESVHSIPNSCLNVVRRGRIDGQVLASISKRRAFEFVTREQEARKPLLPEAICA